MLRISAWLLFLIAATDSFAAAGFPFLRVGASARSAAMGQAVTAVRGPGQLSANPAALDSGAGGGYALSHSEWIQDIGLDEVSALWPRQRGSVGIAAELFRADDLQRRVGPSREPLGEFGIYEWSFAFGGSRTLTESTYAGAALKFIRQSIYTEAAVGAAADLGIIHAYSSRLSVGAVLRNFGGTTRLDRESTDLPRQLRLGAACRLVDALITLDAQWTDGGSVTAHLGTEWRARQQLALRGGFQTADTRSLSAGVGVQLGQWIIDYAFVPFRSELGEAHLFTLSRPRRR